MPNDLLTQWKKDEAAVFEGWDFSYLKGRFIEEKPNWDYEALARKLVKNSASILDVATGGGEVFSSLAPFPAHAVAIEGYPPNVAVAKKKLEPLGVQVLEVNEARVLPFKAETFDLVLNRHGGLNIAETYRVLKNNGSFLTQQVGGDNLTDLMDSFGVEPKWPDNLLNVVRQKMKGVGFQIEQAEDWRGKVTFLDVGAVVYFLNAIPWAVDNFGVDSHLSYLETLQKKLEQQGKLEFSYTRFLIAAKKGIV